MTDEELNKLKTQRPFQPFRVITVDDEAHEVMQSSLILVAGGDVLIGFSGSRERYPTAKDYVYLGLEQIVGVEIIE